ncbi:unnamed protein product [Effrenium voratum]|nr:unnamed protein product [Effrenium voratum]
MAHPYSMRVVLLLSVAHALTHSLEQSQACDSTASLLQTTLELRQGAAKEANVQTTLELQQGAAKEANVQTTLELQQGAAKEANVQTTSGLQQGAAKEANAQTTLGLRQGASKDARRPNLLLILLDQWRFDFVGPSYFPSAQRLGKEGVHFSRAYTASPMCSPSRAALAAGREFSGMWVGSNKDTWYDQMPSPPLPTFMSTLRDAGYATMLAGKDHLSNPPFRLQPAMEASGIEDSARVADKYALCGFPPPFADDYGKYLAELGVFEQQCAVHGMFGFGTACSPTQVCDSTGMECGFRCNITNPLEANVSVDKWVGSRARQMLVNHRSRYGKSKPWFLQVGFSGPHPPFILDTPYRLDFTEPEAFDATFDEELVFQEGVLKRIPHRYKSVMNVPESRAGYAGLLKLIDVEIQQILELVEPERSNTVIVLTSDHGEHLGDHGFFGKESPMEVSLRIPMIIAGPSMRTNAVEDGLVSLIDVGRTFIELAGAEVPPSMQSHSLLPALLSSGPLTRDVVMTGLDYMEEWLDSNTSLGKSQFETAAAMFQGSFLKLVCCPSGCRKQGSLLQSVGFTPQVALMNVTDGHGATKYEHNVLDLDSGFGVPEARQLMRHLGDTFQAACLPLLCRRMH